MNLGIDIRIWGENMGGIGRYTKQLVFSLLKLFPENQYYLFFNQGTFLQNDRLLLEKKQNIQLIKTNIRHYSVQEQILLPQKILKYKLDLMHFPNFNVPLFYKKPFVVTIHDMVHHKISGAKKSRKLHFWAYKKVIKNAAEKAKKIITVSESSKNEIASLLSVGLDKIQVIYEGTSLNNELVTENFIEEVKKEFLIDKPYFLFVGVLERKKNIINICKAFDIFIKKYKYDFNLVIAGKTDKHYPNIKNQALNIQNFGKVIFTGQITEKKLRALFSGAYAFVNASLYEGFGLPGIEAMSFGIPLVVSNIDVFNEIYDSAAIYFDPKNPDDIAQKLHILINNPQFYEQLRQNGINRSQYFTWENTAEQTMSVYKEIHQNE